MAASPQLSFDDPCYFEFTKIQLMRLTTDQIKEHNKQVQEDHLATWEPLQNQLVRNGRDPDELIGKLQDLQIAIPSWALGAGGTRFGRFSTGGEPSNLEQKIEDVGLLHRLSDSAGAISLHIPWDIPEDHKATRALAKEHGLIFDAVNSNTFQDQEGQPASYKFGSLCNVDAGIRRLAIEHNKEVIDHGQRLGSKSLTVWLSDGANFPGQMDFRGALHRTLDSLGEIYEHLPEDWKVFVEYKPYEPNFYSTVIQDWGTSHLLANQLGPKAFSLVDLGHHLPNTNIEQIVATLLWTGKLGGFHFNDSKYGDDDLTVGSIKPFQLFLIFVELAASLSGKAQTLSTKAAPKPEIAWMIDASHNVKDPLEDLLQSLEAIKLAYAQALVLDTAGLGEARRASDVTLAQEIMQDAYRTDVRALLREARIRNNAAAYPMQLYRQLSVRKNLIRERGAKTVATGL